MKQKFILVSKITPKCKFIIKKIDCLGAFKNMIGIALPSLKSSINIMRSGKKNITIFFPSFICEKYKSSPQIAEKIFCCF